MNNYKHALVSSALLIFSGLSFSADKENNEAMSADKIDQFIQGAPLFLKEINVPAIRKLGKIIKEETKKEPNPYAQGSTLLIKQFQFEGLQISGVVDSKDEAGPFFLNSIVIAHPQWKILNGLEVGAPMEKIQQVLGNPMEKNDKVWLYSGTGNQIYFHVKQNKIEKIVFSYYGG